LTLAHPPPPFDLGYLFEDRGADKPVDLSRVTERKSGVSETAKAICGRVVLKDVLENVVPEIAIALDEIIAGLSWTLVRHSLMVASRRPTAELIEAIAVISNRHIQRHHFASVAGLAALAVWSEAVSARWARNFHDHRGQ
jgi:hypothetical protein